MHDRESGQVFEEGEALIIRMLMILIAVVTLGAQPARAGDCGPMPDKKALREVLAELMRAWVPPRNESIALPEPNSRGAKLLTTFCTQCHGLPDPKSYSGDKWPDVMERMVLRLKALGSRRCNLLQLAVPTAEEQRTILAYLRPGQGTALGQ